ncbi:hypothetical protein APHAL10511_007620 [Amanita phalloides]|nr:hypothetical protein APHAL10511_007620 [Amanita phalloides]
MSPTGDPRQSPKPEPIGNLTMILLFTTCAMCIIFLIWRKADSLRSVVSHQLKTFSEPEGRIRLSEDDGPPAHSFIDDDPEEDNSAMPDITRLPHPTQHILEPIH